LTKGPRLSTDDSAPRFYLDTSVQIERRCGAEETRNALKALLADGKHATSTQVRREWNSIVLGACSRLLNALSEVTNIDDLEARMNDGYGREPQHNWMITRWLVARDPDLRRAEMRARQFLRFKSDGAFEEGITTIRDGTECQVARRIAVEDRTRHKWGHNNMCKKDDEICRQPAFFVEQLDRAKGAARALEASSRTADKRMGKHAAAILAKAPNRDSKGKACWGAGGLGGDICIALECRSDETLVTTDQSFDLICPAINVSCRRVTLE
jgi:hypothetical protein